MRCPNEVTKCPRGTRLYDPTIARFMSADSIIPFQYDTQAFNRYSYVKNNPLKYTDPSGHSWLSETMKKLKKWVKKNKDIIIQVVVTVVAIAVTAATAGALAAPLAGSLGAFWGGVATGAIAGAAGGASAGVVGTKLYGGSWSDAFKNGLRGAAAGAIMGGISGGFGNTWNVGRVMLTSIGGGVSSEIMGGDFADGFKMALITSAAAYAYSAITTQSGNKYPQQNTNNGKSHIFQDGKSNVGMDRPGVTDYRSDTHWGMRTLGKLPFMGSFAEFHDSLLDKFKFLQAPGLNELSMIPAYGINIAATYYENYNTFETMRYVNSGR